VIFSGTSLLPIAFLKKRTAAALSRSEQEICGLTLLIERAVEMAPLALHFDIGLIDSPG